MKLKEKKKNQKHRLILLLLAVLFCAGNGAFARDFVPVQTPQQDTLVYPIRDSRTDGITSGNNHGMDLKRPANITDSIIYDPKTKQYYIVEKVGKFYYRKPIALTQAEFLQLMAKKQEMEYFQKRAKLLSGLNYGLQRPKLNFTNNLVNRLFGSGPDGIPKIEIKPQGEVNIITGYQGQRIQNPTLPERAQKNGGFDFDMNYRFNMNASIGERLKFPISQNSLANLDWENQLKLDYAGDADGIIKVLQAGNIAFPTRTTLIPGANQIFGLKTQLQFGKLFTTFVIADMKSQRSSVALQGGAAAQRFEVKADEYEENRHFLVAQYFRKNYKQALSTMPFVNSPVQVRRVEVWVTNRNGTTTDTRDIVGLMDLAETDPFRPYPGGLGGTFPRNEANGLYSQVISTPDIRNPASVSSRLLSLGLQPVQDFEKTFARKLRSDEFYFNPKLGFISLSQPLRDDEVLGIALEYSVNGKVFKIGEFSQDIPPDSLRGISKVLFVKLLKATSARTNLPIWDLMMKNVYSVGYGQLQRQDFQLNVLYSEPSLGEKNYLPEVDADKQLPLLTLLNLDRLNNQNDPQPDGQFDWVDSITVLPQYSRIIFPVLEPFGHDLDYVFTGANATALRNKYLYYPLYDTIKAIAQQQYPNLNRFILKGSSKSSGGAEYNIGFNIPRGSVTVTAGGQVLLENIDYTIDYDLGNVRIINAGILNAGLPVNINYENNAAGFSFQQRNYMALRLDYQANKKLGLGATMVRLGERPFFRKMQYNEDPIRNTMIGADFNYQSGWKQLSRWLDKYVPFFSTTAGSSVTASGEVAAMIPGHPPQINGTNRTGQSFLDDFEGSRSSYDLKFPFNVWTLSSTPYSATDASGNLLIPGANVNNDLAYGKDRAKLAWYQIEQNLQDKRATNNPLRSIPGFLDSISDVRTRLVTQSELFPNRTTDFGQNLLPTFDLAYYPSERGPYNYDGSPATVNANGTLKNPKQRWGGIMRNIDQPDFETANFEFLEFWVQDPFIDRPTASGGQLYFNLGNISEDVLRDGRRFFENGLNTPNIPAAIDTTRWSRVPLNPIQVTTAFSNNPDDRPYQDVGFDGMNDKQEDSARAAVLTSLQGFLNPAAFSAIQADPSSDNYKWYRSGDYDNANAGILTRYKNINNPQGNSPVSSSNSEFSEAYTLYPDGEDLNRDNTLNETEEYFQYKVDLMPNMSIGNNYIVDKRVTSVALANGQSKQVSWYLFRIPVREYYRKVGNIPDFKSIRFIRMFMHNFDQPVVARFARLELVRNQWRQFSFDVADDGVYRPPCAPGTLFSTGAVNIEENDRRTPVNYLSPCDVVRENFQSNNLNLLENEQSMSLVFKGLAPNCSRAVYKTINYDLNQYKKLAMYIHAESAPLPATEVPDKKLYAVVRVGNDYINNFYEVRIPLTVTKPGRYTEADCRIVWPDANNLDVDLDFLRSLKIRRNSSSTPLTTIYRETIGERTFSIMGNPSLGEVRGIMIAVFNSSADVGYSGELWVNELRMIGLSEKGGVAATARVNINLADLGSLNLAATMHTAGFGTLEQRVNERFRDNFLQLDASANLEMGKALPKNWGMSIPVFASYSRTTSKPEYDQYDKDLLLKDKLKAAEASQRDSIRNSSIDQTTIKTLSVSNVKKLNTTGRKTKIYSPENIDLSYSVNKTERQNPLVEQDDVIKHYAGVGYSYTAQAKPWEPFKNSKKLKSKWLSLIKDFNLNPVPSLLGFRADVNRQFGVFRPRNVGVNGYKVPESYNKYFTFDRKYDLRWDLTRSLNIDFSALNNARVDEPFGRLDTRPKRDTVRRNFFDGGRNTVYNQRVNASYTLPVSKLPLTDWTTFNLKYSAEYTWIGASRLVVNLGNIIENRQTRGVTGEFDFNKLYTKARFFRRLDEPPGTVQARPERPKITVDTSTKKGKKKYAKLERKYNKQANKKQPGSMPGLVKGFGKLVTSLKRVNVNFNEDFGTRLPGYMDSTKYLGNNWKTMAPGLDFIMGYQPDTAWLNRAARKNLITRDPLFNELFSQRVNQTLDMTAQLEPIRDFIIDVRLTKSFSKNYNELFKDTVGNGQQFNHLGPYAAGSFNISYIAVKTMFTKFDPNQTSEIFNKFQDYRKILSERLGKQFPYYTQQNITNPVQADGYYYGYNRYATDVLIPSFVAAYTGQSPEKVSLLKQGNKNIRANPFSGFIPKPNWGFTYNGLSRIKGLDKIFSNVSIKHTYNSSLGMNSFNSALFYADTFGLNFPTFYDTVSKNLIPYFLVPNITLSESFEPLLSIDLQFTNRLNVSLDYRKKRDVSLSLIDFQVSELRSTQYGVRVDWTKQAKKGSGKKIKMFGKEIELNNDIRFQLDYSVRDDATSNSRLDQANSFVTGGQRVIRLAPSIDYTLNKRVNLRFFYDRNKVIPNLPSSSPVTTTRAGLEVRVSLAE